LLTEKELERLQHYQCEWFRKHGHHACDNPHAFFHLGDNPAAKICWTGNALFCFPSLRKSMGLLWHAQSETVLVGKERLSLLGWPLYPALATAAGMPLINVPSPKRNALNRFAGNAYHVGAYGMWIAVCLACLRID